MNYIVIDRYPSVKIEDEVHWLDVTTSEKGIRLVTITKAFVLSEFRGLNRYVFVQD